MRYLGWLFVGLYAALIAGFICFDASIFEGLPILSAVTIASLAVFLFGAGSNNLCRPIRRPRLWMPVAAAALMLTALSAGATLALSELFLVPLFPDSDDSNLNACMLLLALLANWLLWGVLLWIYTRRLKRFDILYRLTRFIFAGSLAELLASVPSHIFVMRRGGCFVGISTSLGMIAGMCVMLWSFGPAILLLERSQRRENGRDRRETRTESDAERAPRKGKRILQFGLHTLLGVTAACGILFGLTRIFWGHWFIVALLGSLAVTLAALAIARSRLALAVAAVLVLGGLVYVFIAAGFWIGIVYLLVVAVVLFGLLCVDRAGRLEDDD